MAKFDFMQLKSIDFDVRNTDIIFKLFDTTFITQEHLQFFF